MATALEVKMKILAHFSLTNLPKLKRLLDFGSLRLYLRLFISDLAASET